MKIKDKDIDKFDYVVVLIQKSKRDSILEYYFNFGWKLLTEKQTKIDEQLEIEFFRPHKLKNKDELQYLQINMDCEINKIGKLERDKNKKSITVSVVMGLLGLLLLGLGLYYIIDLNSEITFLIAGILISVFALSLLVIMPFVSFKIYKYEEYKFKQLYTQQKKLIEEISNKAKSLLVEVENDR